MEWAKANPTDDSNISPVDRIGFDMIRAIVSARQAGSPTAKAVCTARMAPGHPPVTAVSAMDLLNGRRIADINCVDGAFLHHSGPAQDYR